MDETYTLIIWEEVPENTKLFIIPNSKILPEHDAFLLLAHNKLINIHDMNPGLEFLNHALASEDAVYKEAYKKYRGIFSSFEVSKESPLVGQHITNVYFSGFML